MRDEGPQLAELLRRLAECPPEFLQVGGSADSSIDVTAIVCDLLRRIAPDRPPEAHWPGISAVGKSQPAAQTLASLAAYLLADEWFLARPQLAPKLYELFQSKALTNLARLVKPERFVRDADRREEFVRTCLRLLELRPQGETQHDALDRLNSLDSVERDRVLKETAKAERRAREVREAMARKKAEEAASRYGE